MVYIALAAAAVLTFIDQLIKKWAATSLIKVGTIPLIKDVFHLTYVENYGAAFSILQNKTILLIIITTIALLLSAYLLIFKKITDKVLISGIALVISGGIGNLIDRVSRGFVVDYLDFRLINFPVFNFADICVVCGTGLIVFYMLFLEDKNIRKAK